MIAITGANGNLGKATIQLATERAILSSGTTYTFLRNSLYMEIIPLFMGNALEKGHWE